MLSLKGGFKGYVGVKWHMFYLVYVTDLGNKIRKLVGRWLRLWWKIMEKLIFFFQNREGGG